MNQEPTFHERFELALAALTRRELKRGAETGRDPYEGPAAALFAARQVHAMMPDGFKGRVRVERLTEVTASGGEVETWGVHVFRGAATVACFQGFGRDLGHLVEAACRAVLMPEFTAGGPEGGRT